MITFSSKAARCHLALAPIGAAWMLNRHRLARLNVPDDLVDLGAIQGAKKEVSTVRARLERLGEISREMKRIVDSIVVTGMPPEQFVARMQELEAEKADVMAGLESAKESDNVIALHPKALDRYKRAVVELADELKCGTPSEFATIRELVTAIFVHASPSRPGGAGTKANTEDDRSVRIDIKGPLFVFLPIFVLLYAIVEKMHVR